MRTYTKPNKPASDRFKLYVSVLGTLFLTILVFGFIILVGELRSINDTQNKLIDNMSGQHKPKETEKVIVEEGDTISRIEFVKFKNETNKTIEDLTKEIRLIQTKLKMKRMSLKRK